ncbi:LOW QUALITY PROTEIN: up-regulator of cell proliferation-like [Aplochiton taeniatus]
MAAEVLEKGRPLNNFIRKVGLLGFYPNKLTLRSLLEINQQCICVSGKHVRSIEDTPWFFLRKLLNINAECRTGLHLENDVEQNSDELRLDLYTAEENTASDDVNPLDLITALFLCADNFLQQEMALKMAMCQFAVPLLLPQGFRSQTTLMLWALRDILKEWRPHTLSESKGFLEDSIVLAKMPYFSFVRLKNCSLSKSQLLNFVLSSGQQHHNIFVHREMEGGAAPKQIANGVVELSWFLPCGTENLDIFTEPIAFANLRGDVCLSEAQFRFLTKVSTATFICMDKIEELEHRLLVSHADVASRLYFVVNRVSQIDMKSVEETMTALKMQKSNVRIKDQRVNSADFSKKLCTVIKNIVAEGCETTNRMCNLATELGLSEDENTSRASRKAAEEIIQGIGVRSIPDYKKQQLPLQGDNWKRLAQLEKEECRLLNAGDQRLEDYKAELQAEMLDLRKKQCKFKSPQAMHTFIASLSNKDKQDRDFFLKWMKLKLDERSRKDLSQLRTRFKEQCAKKDKERIAELDKTLLDSSLGIEHFMREMGQMYEVSFFNPQEPAVKVLHLPKLAADLLLDGYPLELLDGDAGNIPERWVTDVLMELHKEVGEKSRLLVLTVLGVQSTGKSTLLNTMFGVQFPVSSGRCTRGAFMLFLRVGADMLDDLNCDFILLIDTEGLKSSDLAQLEESYEHDNQLATLVISLSDVTIINIAMENSTEMKDILQIAAHAFLRMKDIGKRPVCHFVHQNVAGVSAHSKSMTERKHLLDQLNEMTLIAADMERQPSIKEFTDILDYDIDKNNWYIPGLWHGTPPMAPVNTGYSEAVSDFKKSLLETLKRDNNDDVSKIPDFLKWMSSLWKAVKYENFIFSFRNTLVAHAYDNLWKEFNEWEWAFKKEMFTWLTAAELEISNFELDADTQPLISLVESKKSEALNEIGSQEMQMKSKLQSYYKRTDRHVKLIEKYKMDFLKSIKSLKEEMTHSVCSQLVLEKFSVTPRYH